jgi:hypothetical protein
LARVAEFLDLDGLLVNLGFDSSAAFAPPLADGRSPHEQGAALAVRLRSEVGIDEEDLPYELSDLAWLLEARLGVDIAFEPLTGGLDGLSITRGALRLALVASDVSATRQRFTLAHELAHLAMGDSQDLRVDENVFGRKTDDEHRANALAAAFLMPAGAIRSSMPRGYLSEEAIAHLLGRFGVSLDVLAFRLYKVGVTNAAGRERIRSMSSSRIALRRGRAADLQARNDQRAPGNLLLRAADAYVSGRISIRPLAQLLQVDQERLLDELSPPQPEPVQEDADLDNLEPAL